MKKITLALQAAIFVCGAVVSSAMAQPANTDLAFGKTKDKIAFLDNSAEKSSSNNATVSSEKMEYKEARMMFKSSASQVRVLRANVRALKFMAPRVSDNTSQPVWTYKGRVMLATMQDGDESIEVGFTKRAKWLHTLKTYDPSKMPAEIKALIALKYPSAQPVAARELKERDESYTSYFVRLEDETSYKDVVIYNGETAVYNVVKK